MKNLKRKFLLGLFYFACINFSVFAMEDTKNYTSVESVNFKDLFDNPNLNVVTDFFKCYPKKINDCLNLSPNYFYEGQIYNGYTLLQRACINDDIELAKLLVQLGADINASNFLKQTSMPIAAFYGSLKCLEFFTYLHLVCCYNIDVNYPDASGKTAFHIAADRNHLDALKWLFVLHASVNSRDNVGQTPLYKASIKGNLECVKLLISLGADKNALEIGNFSALDGAKFFDRIDVFNELNDSSISAY